MDCSSSRWSSATTSSSSVARRWTELGERLLDANRTIGKARKETHHGDLCGRRISKHYWGKLKTEIEEMDLPDR